MADALLALLDVGGTGTLEFQTSGGVEVATCTLSATAFGAASNGVATANAITNDSNATGGTVAQFEMKNNAGAVVISGSVTVTGGGGDIELSSVVVAPGDAVAVTSLQYTAAP
jgi:hypothetical protein